MCLFQRHGVRKRDTKTFIKEKESRKEEEEDNNVSSVLLSREITVMCHIMTSRSVTDHIYNGGPIIIYYIMILYCNTVVLQLPTVFSTVMCSTSL